MVPQRATRRSKKAVSIPGQQRTLGHDPARAGAERVLVVPREAAVRRDLQQLPLPGDGDQQIAVREDLMHAHVLGVVGRAAAEEFAGGA